MVESATAGPNQEVAELIGELENEGWLMADKVVSQAELFWMLSEFFLAGMEQSSIFPTAMAALATGTQDERGRAANYVARELVFKLRALGLVRDENRMQRQRGYSVVVCTELGVRAVRALMAKKWPRPAL